LQSKIFRSKGGKGKNSAPFCGAVLDLFHNPSYL
jgi:hypothetical protein